MNLFLFCDVFCQKTKRMPKKGDSQLNAAVMAGNDTF